MNDKDDKPAGERPNDERVDEAPRLINADDLFQGSREVCIDLGGIRYRLRITRRNKLILQK